MWTKKFLDGSEISEPASWSQTRLEDIHSVYLDGVTIANPGGEFWQSDDYIADVKSGPQTAQMITRRIQTRVPDDKNEVYIHQWDNRIQVFFDALMSAWWEVQIRQQWKTETVMSTINLANHRNKWLVLEKNLQNKSSKYYFSDERI